MSRAAADAYVSCVSKGFEQIHELSKGLATWIEERFYDSERVLGVYEETPGLLKDYFQQATQEVGAIAVESKRATAPVQIEALDENLRRLRALQSLREDFDMDSQECVTLLRERNGGA